VVVVNEFGGPEVYAIAQVDAATVAPGQVVVEVAVSG
jgi:NADPH:quinone reductase-like Zn-dependent oxidoreductase